MDTFDAIRQRRSIGVLTAPGPSEEALRVMLEAAVLAPDHKELRPWRFVILRGTAKDTFGERLAEALVKREPSATEGQIDKERHKLDRAPLVIVVATKRVDTSLPFEELLAATSAATQNFLLAATDLGYATMWRTGEMTTDPNIKRLLGLETQDAIVGFVYVGTDANPPRPLKSPRLDGVVADWRP